MDTARSGTTDEVAALRQDVISLNHVCQALKTAGSDEPEHARLLSTAISSVHRSMDGLENVKDNDAGLERLLVGIRALVAELDAVLNRPDSCPSFTEGPKWQVNEAEMAKLLSMSDDLIARIRHHKYPPRPNSGPDYAKAPSNLLIDSLARLKNRRILQSKLGPWLSINELRGWIDHCDGHHANHCQLSRRSESLFAQRPRWLVDVEQSCLVPAEASHRYLALSYVWGRGSAFTTRKHNIAFLQTKGSLNSPSRAENSEHGSPSLPPTIRDVMELTRQLRERYLWVDSLCIVQDDHEHKQEHLGHMGSIYANAYLTVVAAGGTAFSGLRGVKWITSPMQRKQYPPAYLLRPNSLHDEIRRHHRELANSPWNQRAWTFQEQIFSRRLLVLDNHTVAWECHCAVWFEGLDAVEGRCLDNSEVVAQGFSFRVPPRFDDYASHVRQYNRRELTYPEDALDAFGGVLATLSTAFTGGFVCGLPVMFFDEAVLWYNEKPVTRRYPNRPGYEDVVAPSWSWAAWAGAVTFPSTSPEALMPLVLWWYSENTKQGWKPIQSQKSEADSLKHDKTPPIPPACHQHLLFAHPTRAFFRVMDYYGNSGVPIQGDSGECVGMLTACEALGAKPNASHITCEVVAVSETSMEGQKLYNVLWIEWNAGVAYRKGVGRVMKEGWDAQSPERVDMFLG